MMKKGMYGVVIPMITPMNEDGSIDIRSLEDFTEYLIQAGVNCLYPNGTNGEDLFLSQEERQTVAATIVKTAKRRIPVFIQCGAMTTAETVSHIQHAEKIGADGAGIMTPAFFPMDDEALFQYYSEVIGSVSENFPIYLYNIPGATTNDISPALLKTLMDRHPNILGIKYSFPDLMRIEDYLLAPQRTPDVLIGCDSLFLQCLATGGVGTVTGPGAIFHERFSRLYRQYLQGDLTGAMKTQTQIVETDRDMASIPGIPGLKALLKLRGVIRCDTCRKPLRALNRDERLTLERIYKKYIMEEQINE